MESSVVELRGHHLLSLFFCFSSEESRGRIGYMALFRKKNYGKKFAENEKRVFLKICDNPETKIRLVARKDNICKSCRIKRCGTTVKYDKKFIRNFGCEVNGVYSLEALLKKGNDLIEAYKKSLPSKRGRPKIEIAIGSMLDELKG